MCVREFVCVGVCEGSFRRVDDECIRVTYGFSIVRSCEGRCVRKDAVRVHVRVRVRVRVPAHVRVRVRVHVYVPTPHSEHERESMCTINTICTICVTPYAYRTCSIQPSP